MTIKKKAEATHGDAYEAVRCIYRNSPGQSWRRLNGALQGALAAAITAHLSFLPDDFAAIAGDMRGGYWMGSGDGSECGERYYNLMVEVGHTAACIAFEKYAGRPAAFWSEDVKTPARLCVGSQFTWNGVKVTVTSMKTDHLVACTYHGNRYSNDDRLAIGHFEHLNDGKYRQMEEIAHIEGGGLSIRFSAPVDDPYSSKVKTVTKITYKELAAKRLAYDTSQRVAMKDIAAAKDLPELEAISQMLAKFATEGHYRHFDIEAIRKAITEREKAFGLDRQALARKAAYAKSEAADLEAWANGEPRRGRFFETVRLRVMDGRVETSTGQRATVEAVRRVLPIVLRRRESRGPVVNLMVDSYRVEQFSDEGVQIGCTLIPWSEVERLPALLEAPCER